MDNENFGRLRKYIDGQEKELIRVMKALVSIKALGPLNGGTGEAEKGAWLMDYLKKSGFGDVKNYPAPDPSVPAGERPNIVARIPGKRTDKSIWIMSHMDVVPEGDLEKWETPPYEAVVKDGKIFGRGTEDNHQGLVASLLAAKAFIDLNIVPEYNLNLVFVSDEETNSIYGLEYLVEHHADLFRKEDIYIIPDAGEPDSTMIEIAEKSILWLRFVTKGKQVHASTPERGVNAFKAASHFIVKLGDLYTRFADSDPVFDPPISTFEPTQREANVPNVNTIPGDDVFYLDCRILPHYNLDEIQNVIREMMTEIEQEFGVRITMEEVQREEAAPATAVDAPVVGLLARAIREVYKVQAGPVGIGGGTVAAVFRRAGFDAAVWSTLDDMAHQPNEYCRISNVLKDAQVFAHVASHTIE